MPLHMTLLYPTVTHIQVPHVSPHDATKSSTWLYRQMYLCMAVCVSPWVGVRILVSMDLFGRVDGDLDRDRGCMDPCADARMDGLMHKLPKVFTCICKGIRTHV